MAREKTKTTAQIVTDSLKKNQQAYVIRVKKGTRLHKALEEFKAEGGKIATFTKGLWTKEFVTENEPDEKNKKTSDKSVDM